jgi:hypothetical protein
MQKEAEGRDLHRSRALRQDLGLVTSLTTQHAWILAFDVRQLLHLEVPAFNLELLSRWLLQTLCSAIRSFEYTKVQLGFPCL